MSAALPLAILAAVEELARQWPERWPDLPPWPATSQDRLLRTLGAGAQHTLRYRIALRPPSGTLPADVGALVAFVRMPSGGVPSEVDKLERDLRPLVPAERHRWLAEQVHDCVAPWLEASLRVALAGVLCALEHSH